MPTKKLFYENSYIRSFEALVLTCRRDVDNFIVLLDQTAFYPEGGGQPCDRGVLDDARVLDVWEEDGNIFHRTDTEFEPGIQVSGEIDWPYRFDLMQQHTAEHIVSGIVRRQYGYNNVGFHMGGDVITIDFSGMLDASQLKKIEQEANEAVFQNLPVLSFYPEKEQLASMDYRSKKELNGNVRIVEIPNYDRCACCGLHAKSTGELGIIRMLIVQKFKGGVRVEMISGWRCLDGYRRLFEQNTRISRLLSAKPDRTYEAAYRLFEENKELKRAQICAEDRLFEKISSDCAGTGDLLIMEDGLMPDSVRRLAISLMEKRIGRVAVFSSVPDGGYVYAMGDQSGNLKEFTDHLNYALSGRGGGRPNFVQGSVQCTGEEIRRFFNEN